MLGAEFALRQCTGNEVRGRRDRGALAPPFTGADQTGRTRDVCLLTTGGLIGVRRRAPRNKRSQLDDVAVRIFDIRERHPWGMLAALNQLAAGGFNLRDGRVEIGRVG